MDKNLAGQPWAKPRHDGGHKPDPKVTRLFRAGP